jgi:hypothetical protein
MAARAAAAAIWINFILRFVLGLGDAYQMPLLPRENSKKPSSGGIRPRGHGQFIYSDRPSKHPSHLVGKALESQDATPARRKPTLSTRPMGHLDRGLRKSLSNQYLGAPTSHHASSGSLFSAISVSRGLPLKVQGMPDQLWSDHTALQHSQWSWSRSARGRAI